MEQKKQPKAVVQRPKTGLTQAKKAGAPAQAPKPRRELTHRIIVTRAKVAMAVVMALLLALCGRLAFLQLADPYSYADKALEQYTYEVKIEAKRGTIYASDGTTRLAVSATTQTVFISPSDVYSAGTKQKDDSTPAPGEEAHLREIAEGLAACLDDYNAQTLIDKYHALGDSKTRYKYLIVKKDISEAEEARVRAFIKENGLQAEVALEEGTRRYYPYSTLASHLLGFTGSDNTGLGGLEYTYNEYLSGVDGRVVRAQDAHGNEMPFSYASYIEAQDGLNLVTTIDWTVQSVVEKYIKQTYQEHAPEGRVSCIVMDVKTGEILALAIYPDYDLNNYAKLSPEYQAKLDAYEGEDKSTFRSTLMNQMWNNTIASQTYEPGSTFKVITAAMALETGSITPAQLFSCGGSIKIGNAPPIHCWFHGDHGMQNLAKALVNSCNPAFVQIGRLVGQKKFSDFFEAFGYTKKTGADLVGEVSSIYYETTGAEFTELSLAAYSFGQTFKVTMLQHIAAVSAVANGGYLVTPHVGKYLTDQNNNIVKTFSSDPVRQVVSKSVCEEIMSSLVDSTKNACVKGYHVVSKTGTSEKRDTTDPDDYVSSCVTFAPAEDPQIAILVTVDTPTGGQIYGSQVAAPAVSRILTEVLPYLGIAPSSAESIVDMVTLSDYRGNPVSDAKAAVEALGMKCIVKGEGDTVSTQLPRVGTVVAKGGTVVLYTDATAAQATISVPNVLNSTPEAAVRALTAKGLNVRLEGDNSGSVDCYIYAQSVEAGTMVEAGTVITLECRYNNHND